VGRGYPKRAEPDEADPESYEAKGRELGIKPDETRTPISIFLVSLIPTLMGRGV